MRFFIECGNMRSRAISARLGLLIGHLQISGSPKAPRYGLSVYLLYFLFPAAIFPDLTSKNMRHLRFYHELRIAFFLQIF